MKGEEDDLAEVRRLLKEVKAEKASYHGTTVQIGKKLLSMKGSLKDAGYR